MRFYILFLIFTINFTQGQVTEPVFADSNANGFNIRKITITNKYTVIDFKIEVPYDGYRFAILNTMYITSAHGNSEKFFIKEFYNNELNTWYTLNKGDVHEFSLLFEKIPKGLNYINIIEPDDGVDNTTAWYWKNIYVENY